MKYLPLFVLIFAAIILAGCRKTPEGVIEPKEMVSLLVDIHKGESAIEFNRRDYKTDSSKLALREAIYKRHNVNQEMFDTSMNWYGHNIDEYMKVYDNVIEQLQKEIDNSDAVAAKIQMSAIGDSVDVWSLSPRFVLNAYSPLKILDFELLADENWEKGDNYTLNFKVINNQSRLNSLLGVEYSDGMIEWNPNTISDNGKASFTVIADSTKSISKVFGYISVYPRAEETVFLDSISLLRTRVNRQNYSRRFSQKKIHPKLHDDLNKVIPDSFPNIVGNES